MVYPKPFHGLGKKASPFSLNYFVLPLLLDKTTPFLPKLLVLECILDDFSYFLPLLLEYIYNFAPTKHKKGMIWHITKDI